MSVTRLPLHTAVRAVLSLAAACAVIAVAAGVAYAHATLVSTDPADGSTIAKEPAQVSLKFNQNIGTPAYVVVAAPDGSHVDKGDPQVVDHTVTQPVERSAIAGKYTMSYRVVSADGHPVEGTIGYTVRDGRKLTAQEAGGSDGDKTESFVHQHKTHLLWGLGGVVTAGALLLWPRRRRDA